MTPRLSAVVVLAVLVVAAGLVALTRAPRRRPPAPRADQRAALASLPADAVARGRAFHRALRPPGYAARVLSLVVVLLLGLTPLAARIVALVGGHWAVRAVLGGLIVVFLAGLVTLPLAGWREVVMRRYGLSTRSWRGWLVDVLKGYAVGAVLGAVALLGFYAVARYTGQWWWVWAALGAAALTVLLSFVFPVLVEPVFNKFTPMADGPLRSALLDLAARDRVPVRDVLVADASRRTRAVNAYVSGLGPTRRIVVYDTLLDRAGAAEVVSVVAHELGHARDRDVVTGTVLGALGAAGAVIAVYLVGAWTALLGLSGADSVREPRSIGLLMALAAIAGLIAEPAQNALSRRIEARADAHALALTDDPATFEAMEARLATVNLADPDPPRWEHLLFASHPATVERMAAARAYARGQR
ncbi:MAG: M48 family metallopeptidase [Actinobacteria bacterium]|nr:MAG: M48 family metallopeptidase [Actinomycetota bacterium]